MPDKVFIIRSHSFYASLYRYYTTVPSFAQCKACELSITEAKCLAVASKPASD